ncbi:MAG TPA: GNAT family N-acetyltransferase [Pyrinomonadaceae bacterium]
MRLPTHIETERLLLRPPALGDAPAIYETYARDPEVTRYLIWRPHRSLADTEEFLRAHLARRVADADDAAAQGSVEVSAEVSWVLILKEGDQLAGMLAVHPAEFRVGLGYVLGRAYWGRGLMTEAVRAVTELALAQPEVFRVWAVCDVDNRASARVLEKAGLAREGVLRRWSLHPNVSAAPRDCLCYAKVR